MFKKISDVIFKVMRHKNSGVRVVVDIIYRPVGALGVKRFIAIMEGEGQRDAARVVLRVEADDGESLHAGFHGSEGAMINREVSGGCEGFYLVIGHGVGSLVRDYSANTHN